MYSTIIYDDNTIVDVQNRYDGGKYVEPNFLLLEGHGIRLRDMLKMANYYYKVQV